MLLIYRVIQSVSEDELLRTLSEKSEYINVYTSTYAKQILRFAQDDTDGKLKIEDDV